MAQEPIRPLIDMDFAALEQRIAAAMDEKPLTAEQLRMPRTNCVDGVYGGLQLQFVTPCTTRQANNRSNIVPAHVFQGLKRVFKSVTEYFRESPLSVELVQWIRAELMSLCGFENLDCDKMRVNQAAWILLNAATEAWESVPREEIRPAILEAIAGSLYRGTFPVIVISPARQYILAGLAKRLQAQLQSQVEAYFLVGCDVLGETPQPGGYLSRDHFAAVCFRSLVGAMRPLQRALPDLEDTWSLPVREAAADAIDSTQDDQLRLTIDGLSVTLGSNAVVSLTTHMCQRLEDRRRRCGGGLSLVSSDRPYPPENEFDTKLWYAQQLALEMLGTAGWDSANGTDLIRARFVTAIQAVDARFRSSTQPRFDEDTRGFFQQDSLHSFHRAVSNTAINQILDHSAAVRGFRHQFLQKPGYASVMPLMMCMDITSRIWAAAVPKDLIPESEQLDWPIVGEVWGQAGEPKTWLFITGRHFEALKRWPIVQATAFTVTRPTEIPLDEFLEKGLERIFSLQPVEPIVEAPAQGRALRLRKGFTPKRAAD